MSLLGFKLPGKRSTPLQRRPMHELALSIGPLYHIDNGSFLFTEQKIEYVEQSEKEEKEELAILSARGSRRDSLFKKFVFSTKKSKTTEDMEKDRNMYDKRKSLFRLVAQLQDNNNDKLNCTTTAKQKEVSTTEAQNEIADLQSSSNDDEEEEEEEEDNNNNSSSPNITNNTHNCSQAIPPLALEKISKIKTCRANVTTSTTASTTTTKNSSHNESEVEGETGEKHSKATSRQASSSEESSSPNGSNNCEKSPKFKTKHEILLDLLEKGDLKSLMELVTSELSQQPNSDINTLFVDVNGATILHKAAKTPSTAQVAIVSYLISIGANVESKDNTEATPLMYAAANNCAKSCGSLIAQGASLNVRDKYQMTPLWLALKNNHMDTASTLLLFGADINFKGARGNTALHRACEEGNLEKVKFLIENGANIYRTNSKSQTCLFKALHAPKVVSLVIDMMSVVEKGEQKVAKYLMTLDEDGQGVVHICAIHGYIRTLLTIIRKAKLLDDSFLNCQDTLTGNAPLHFAVMNDQYEVAKFLCLCKGTNIDICNHAGNTPLHIAIMNNQFKMMELLLKVGQASYKIKNKQNKTSKQIAKENKIVLKNLLNIPSTPSGSVSSSSSSSASSSSSSSVSSASSSSLSQSSMSAGISASNKLFLKDYQELGNESEVSLSRIAKCHSADKNSFKDRVTSIRKSISMNVSKFHNQMHLGTESVI